MDMRTAEEICQDYFGTTNTSEIHGWMYKFYYNICHETVSEETCNLSLFPYRAPGLLDTPLPTVADIVAARPVANIHDMHAHVWPVRYTSCHISSLTSLTHYQEAENLLFLEKNSTVRVPKLYLATTCKSPELFPHPSYCARLNTGYYMILERIHGETLMSAEKGGEELSPRICRKVGELLGEQIRRLRSIVPEDPNHFGRVGGRKYQVIPPFFYPPSKDPSDRGPFNYEDVTQRLINCGKTEAALCLDDWHYFMRLLFKDARKVLLDMAKPEDRLPVLSHMDAGGGNMIIKFVRDKEREIRDVEEVVLIDWEYMSWMPSWYESAEMLKATFYGETTELGIKQEVLSVMGRVNMILISFVAVAMKNAVFRTVS
ncbi:hypothetical protein CC80DRAFT_508616 [Byssothecium circinans]|uniref:Aminoglycoside phosphotransferase domain-containing protein n=1 Tax=Byssothecium circinans TaxID=147558 RepID=A0A6A5THT5_9PLEO|nr:hypothetical protein CC80DRAFT_508616 [Byssothecium circinans]